MKRGPMIHGILLVVALLFAYQSWTQVETIEPKTGDISVWKLSKESITSITFDSKTKSVRLEKRKQGNDTYWWGTQTTTSKKKVELPDLPPTPTGESDGEPPEPTFETVSKVREFALGDRGMAVIDHLTKLNALQSFGDLSDEKLAEYSLTDSTKNVTVSHPGGSESIVVGAQVFRGSDRFVQHTETGKTYVVAGLVLQDLMNGEGGLQVRKMHAYKPDELAKVVVKVGEESQEWLRISIPNPAKPEVQKKSWANGQTPDKPEQTLVNFLDRVAKLSPLGYEPELDTKDLTMLVKIDYRAADGRNLGVFEMYSQVIETETKPKNGPADPSKPVGPDARKPAGTEAGQPASKPAAAKPAANDVGKAEAKPGPVGKDEAGKGKDEAGKDEAGKDEAEADKKYDTLGFNVSPEQVKDDSKKLKTSTEQRTAYYMRTERTRVLTLLKQEAASRVAEDIEQIFAK